MNTFYRPLILFVFSLPLFRIVGLPRSFPLFVLGFLRVDTVIFCSPTSEEFGIVDFFIDLLPQSFTSGYFFFVFFGIAMSTAFLLPSGGVRDFLISISHSA